MTTRIVLADDHAVVRQGLRAALGAEPGFEIVGEVADGLAVAEACEKLAPDVLVLDLMMPGLGGLDVAREVRRRTPKVAILVLSMHAEEAYVIAALRNGASGYVSKEASVTELARAIRAIAAGGRHLGPPFSERSVDAWLRRAGEAAGDLYESLSPREREVFHLAAEGWTSTAIGKRLSISPRTVETHRANVLRKLGLRGQTELVRYAIRRGILPDERAPRGAAGETAG